MARDAGPRRPPETREKKRVAWLTLMVPVELSDRMVRVIRAANDKRPIDRRFVSKSGFAVACIEEGVREAEKGMGIA